MGKTVTLPIKEYNALVDAEALIVKKYSHKQKQAEDAEEKAIKVLDDAIEKLDGHVVVVDCLFHEGFSIPSFDRVLKRVRDLDIAASKVKTKFKTTLYDELLKSNEDIEDELRKTKRELDDIKSLGFFGRLVVLLFGFED